MKNLAAFKMPSDAELEASWHRRMEANRRDPNCITHWLPRIAGHVPTPRTEIVRMDLDRAADSALWSVLDGNTPPVWFEPWVETLRAAARRISTEGPWFLRTGVFSGKHDWKHCCAVHDLQRIGDHVLNIFNMSAIVDVAGLPYHVWAVREWLSGPVVRCYEPFGGMPLRREFRAFAKAGEVLCIHPYWPADALDAETASLMDFLAMNELGHDHDAVHALAAEASRHVEGEWSIDCLWTDRGWYVTDMAIASMSYHWPDCKRSAPTGYKDA